MLRPERGFGSRGRFSLAVARQSIWWHRAKLANGPGGVPDREAAGAAGGSAERPIPLWSGPATLGRRVSEAPAHTGLLKLPSDVLLDLAHSDNISTPARLPTPRTTLRAG